MISSCLEFKVQYADTDAYKVAWHGSYLRFMEAGRVDWLYKNGVDIKELDEKYNIVMPVVEINIKYKQSAKLLDKIFVKTVVSEITPVYIVFEQQITDEKGSILTNANVKGVALKNGKIQRNLDKLLKRGQKG